MVLCHMAIKGESNKVRILILAYFKSPKLDEQNYKPKAS